MAKIISIATYLALSLALCGTLTAQDYRSQLKDDSRIVIDNLKTVGCEESFNKEPWRTVKTRIKVECQIQFIVGEDYQFAVGYYENWTDAGKEKGRWMDTLESVLAEKQRPVKLAKK